MAVGAIVRGRGPANRCCCTISFNSAQPAKRHGRSAPRSADRQPEHRLSVSAEHLLPLVEAGREGRRHPGRALEPRPTGRCRHRRRTGRCQGRRHGEAAWPYEQAHNGRSLRPRSARSPSPCRSRACRFPKQKRTRERECGQRACSNAHASTRSGLNAGCDYRRVSRHRRQNALRGAGPFSLWVGIGRPPPS